MEEAATGRAAMAKIETGHYDVITLDLRLPDVDGTAILGVAPRARSVHGRRGWCSLRATTMNPDTQTFLQGTGRPVLAKPFIVECLGVAVEAVLAEAPAAAIRDPQSQAPRRIGRTSALYFEVFGDVYLPRATPALAERELAINPPSMASATASHATR